jgi:ketosteroid isomerase-like protein
MTGSTVPSAREVAELIRQRLADVDMSGLVDLFADDAVFEYPFGFPGAPSELRGRDEIRAHLVESRRDVPSLIDVTEVHSTVHETTDPDVVVCELEVAGTTTATGEPFRFASSVGVLTVHNGLVVRFRDYTNVLGAAAATGRTRDAVFAPTESV